jgi:hypothetical protein
MTTVDVQPESLLEAARVLYAGAEPSWFETKANGQLGPRVTDSCDAFVQRLVRAAMTKELIGLAGALETASGLYLYTDANVARQASGHGG